MKVVSLIHTYLNPVDLDLVLNALTNQVANPKFTHEIVVIENGLPESLQPMHQGKYPNVQYVKSDKFIGISQGINLGIKFALQIEADYTWLTDPFIIPSNDMLNQLFAASETYKDCLGFTPKTYIDSNMKTIYAAGFVTNWDDLTFNPRGNNEQDQAIFDRDLEVDYIPLNQLFLRSKTWSEVGLLDARYFIQYSDLDLFTKIRSKGYRLNFISLAHAIKASGEFPLPPTALTYYSLRDKIYYSLLHGPVSTKISSLKIAYDKYMHGDRWEKQAIRDILRANLGPGSYQW